MRRACAMRVRAVAFVDALARAPLPTRRSACRRRGAHAPSMAAPSQSPSPSPLASEVDYISASTAAQLDRALMSDEYGHSLPQLMELAGLSVAEAVALSVPNKRDPLCVVCGPGNNGGDGLVAARHLFHFGFHDVRVWLPKPPTKPLFTSLCTQLRALSLPVHCAEQLSLRDVRTVVDAVFGFSFDGSEGVRAPYRRVIAEMNECSHATLVCVDVPSGWHVDDGNVWPHALRVPDVLVSLSAPKLCARHAESNGARHFVGGRFIPPQLSAQLRFRVAPYHGTAMVTRLS
eukprot:gb/GEZJ01000604.1/.p2 GENE.gb/GEZJ01000604.1/~~gb/GEZJ01000604.1/.p2  ORF type:complete len:289 (-),score=44.48 gb/GEZJ01000604.1/:3168-4034(-)